MIVFLATALGALIGVAAAFGANTWKELARAKEAHAARVAEWYGAFVHALLRSINIRRALLAGNLTEGRQERAHGELVAATDQYIGTLMNRRLLWETKALYGDGREFMAVKELMQEMSKKIKYYESNVVVCGNANEWEEYTTSVTQDLTQKLEPLFDAVSELLLRSSIGVQMQRLKANIIGPQFPAD